MKKLLVIKGILGVDYKTKNLLFINSNKRKRYDLWTEPQFNDFVVRLKLKRQPNHSNPITFLSTDGNELSLKRKLEKGQKITFIQGFLLHEANQMF